MASQKTSVIIVTPAHNEEDGLNIVAQSVFVQTLSPTEWIIVDDASTDRTLEVANRLAQGRGSIKAVHHDHEGGSYDASFKAFSFGVDQIDADWQFLVKLDADTRIPPEHIERLVAKFGADTLLGIASGVNVNESGISSHPRGNNRMYRRECWEKIKFPDDGWGWDTVDEAFAGMNGWKSAAFADIVCQHLRSKLPDTGYRFHQGKLSRHLGYYWWFALGRSIRISLASGLRPSVAYFAGYLWGGLGSTDPEVKEAIKRDQLRRLRRILIPNAKSSIPIAEFEPAIYGKEPSIVIGMPTKNRARYLPRILAALHECDYPKKSVRLVFVDAYSTDGTLELLEQFASDHRAEYEEVSVLREHGNIPSARNVCIQQVGNVDCLVFLDSDVLVERDFLRVLLRLSKVGGIASICYGSSDKNADPAVKYAENVGMGCTVIRKDVLKALGPFDETLSVGEDTDYCLRAGARGFKIVQDSTRQFLHFDEGRYRNGDIIWRSFRNRRVYSKICRLGVYFKRFLLYSFLDICLALGILFNYLFLLPIVAYFLAQLGKRSGMKFAFLVTLNSLIIAPVTLLGALERKLGRS